MEGVLATDLRDTVGIVPRIPPSSFSPFSLLALLPSFTLDILSLPLLYFSNNLWKRSVEISRRWHFSTFHDCFRERISFYYIRSLTSFGCSVEIPDRGWNSVNVLSKFSRLEYHFRDSRILWRQVFSKITNKSSSVHLLKLVARRLNDVETNYLRKIQRSLRELEGVE